MPGVKDGPRNLKQMGAGRGVSALSGGNKTTGKAQRMAKAQANKEIKASRKQSGVSKLAAPYPKSSYGRKSVNPTMPSAKTKASSGRMSSGYKKGPGRG